MSRQVHQNKYQNKISYLGLALTESGLHACLDLHPDRRRCRRSRSRRSRHDRHPKLVDVHDVERVMSQWLVTWFDVQNVELITDSSSLRHWRCCVIVPYTHCQTRHVVDVVVRDAIVMSTRDSWQDHDIMNSFLELWFYKSIRSSCKSILF
jgi:hypothetical protein